MIDEIKIPNDLLRKCVVVDVGVASQIIARWMREECAKVDDDFSNLGLDEFNNKYKSRSDESLADVIRRVGNA